MGRTVKYKLIPTPHFVKDFSKLDEFVKKRIKISWNFKIKMIPLWQEKINLKNIDFSLDRVLENYLSGKIYYIYSNSKSIQEKSKKAKK